MQGGAVLFWARLVIAASRMTVALRQCVTGIFHRER